MNVPHKRIAYSGRGCASARSVASELDGRIGKKIRYARLQKGMTQSQLAAALGLSHGIIQHYETGRHAISVSRLWEIACLARKPIWWFFE